MADAFTPYTTATPYFGQKPSWIPDPLDQARIQAYTAYEQMYYNSPNVFKISLRGANDLPIYVPSARTIVDTTARYVGTDMSVVVSGTSTADVVAAQMAIADLMKRERFRSRYNGGKRYGLIQGDWLWHLTADQAKDVGKRIKMTVIDPSLYFPIPDPDDVDKTIAVHLAETITTADGERVRRVTYRKIPGGAVTVEEGIFLIEDWYGLESKPETIVRPVTALPPEITTIPVYHTKNTEEPGNPFGSSELRTLEPIMGAVNQTMSDEDLALALMGIGMWATDASHPIDPITGKQVAWQMGPGRVVHHDGTKFDKIAGTGSLADSYGEHYDRLWEAIYRASSTPEVAIGGMDVSVAASGVALQIQLGPMISKASEKNDLLGDSQTQMFYDIVHMWMPAYEDTVFAEDLAVDTTFGSAIPVDREAKFTELNDMLDRGVIDTAYYREQTKLLGYVYPEGMDERAKAEYDGRQQQQDAFADRVTAETDGTEDDGVPA